MRSYKTLGSLIGLMLWAGCGGSSDVKCGDGTKLHGGVCTIADAGPAVGKTDSSMPTAGSGSTLTCGDGTTAVDGKCIPTDGGALIAKGPVGAACGSGDDCQTGTCAPAADNLPGGLCTILGCSMDNPCPNGSTCYALNKSLSLCMPYCDRDSECRSGGDYHCQPLYANALNICAPSCSVTKTCTAGTRCNADSGLCEIAECDVASPGKACSDQETCVADSKGLSSKGGLCLHLCKPSHPEKNCLVDQNEVCQPLANDPANAGFCAPPVCSKTSECPAGAQCLKSVCQPPALCDSNSHCADDSTTCVSGKCMPKCPTGDKHCSDVHPGLVCADVLSTPACLPAASFPGSACRASADNRCDSLTVGGATAAMVCENNTCLADCTAGGQPLCSGLSDSLTCAHGIFPTDLCLPKGSYPGSACGAGNSCAQDLNGDPAVDMQCLNGTCVIGCSETDKWSGYGDALCALVDPTLTCADSAGSICVRACTGGNGTCDTGYSCLDPGAAHTHDNACLPDGTFPGSTCRPSSGDQCDQNLGGNSAVDMVCSNNTCVVSCPSNNDALCHGVNPSLTCSESAGNLCVFACVSGACPSGYSCLDPGDSSHQNACLPSGTFPGSACRATTGNECDQNLGGNSAVDMVCTNHVCTVSCPNNNDGLCSGVNPSLTCSESAGNLCVLGCVSGACPSGYSCLDPGDSTHQNACLPTGSFPSSPCRTTSGDQCDQNLGGNSAADMVCVNNACVVSCPNNNDGLCSGVNPGLTCSESAGNLCVFACVSGACPTGYSCLDPGNSAHQNACLPTGTFPGSPCRSGSSKCDADLNGNANVHMQCASNTCVVGCATNNDALCMAVSPSLTCSVVASNICVPACVSGACPTGYSCFNAENACLPSG